MRVFILGTGRCGTNTLAHALNQSVTNYTVGFESKARVLRGRLDYPDNHIEVDNRLHFFLGSLYKRYPDAFYVHLTRDPKKVAASWAKRDAVKYGLWDIFSNGILYRPPELKAMRARVRRRTGEGGAEEASTLMVTTIRDNIDLFLTEVVAPERRAWIELEDPAAALADVWNRIGAGGALGRALELVREVHNSSREDRARIA